MTGCALSFLLAFFVRGKLLKAQVHGEKIMRQLLLLLISAVASFAATRAVQAESAPKPPNIVYILCDDLGYGDVHALNPERGKIATPNIDRLASQGMIFTDAHAGSSVCTPSGYGILTGRYCWRTKLQSSVLSGSDLPLIAPDRLTVASLLKQHGYATACIGKWHLGLKYIQATEAGHVAGAGGLNSRGNARPIFHPSWAPVID
jgi:arylsulfatase A-like enzyme